MKLRAMQAHQDRVEQLKLHGEQIIHQFHSTDCIKVDLQNFTQRWQKAFNAIGKDTILFLFNAIVGIWLFLCVFFLKWVSQHEIFIVILEFWVCNIWVNFCKSTNSAEEIKLTKLYTLSSRAGLELNQM